MRRLRSRMSDTGHSTRRIGSIDLRAYPAPAGPQVPSEVLTTELFSATLDARTENRRRFGRSLSMDRIEAALRAAYRGSMRDITDILHETIDTDPHLGSILNKRFGALSALPFEVQPASGVGIDRKKAMFYAEVVRQQLRNMKSFRRNIGQLAWALFDGRACLELKWIELGIGSGPADVAFGQPSMAVQTMEWIHPRRLSFGPTRELRIQPEQIMISGNFPTAGLAVTELPDKFVWWLPQLFNEYPEREGLGIRCMYWSFFKRFAARERMVLTELYGKPWRIIEVDEESSAGSDELKAADQIVDALGASYTARMPRGTKLSVVSPGRNAGQVHQEVIDQADSQNSKLVLGQTGTTDGVPAGLNSDQASVMQNEQLGVLLRDAAQLSETIETLLTDRIIAINFGEDAVTHAPVFRLRADLPANRGLELDRLQKALNAGLSIQRNEAYEISGFSIPEDEDVVVRIDQPPTPMNSPVAPAIRPVVVYPVGTTPDVGQQQPITPIAQAGAEAPTTEGAQVGVVDSSSAITVNEDRASRGLGELLLPDGTPDERGGMTVAEFKADIEANKAAQAAPATGVLNLPAPPALGLSRRAFTLEAENVAQEIGEGEELHGEAGIHAHEVMRALEATALDGRHAHVFKLPDGSYVFTMLDGSHMHGLDNPDVDETLVDGEHDHGIIVNGVAMMVGSGISAHSHSLQVAATAVDGAHRHTLDIPDPSEPTRTKQIRSMSASEFAADMRAGLVPASVMQYVDPDEPDETSAGRRMVFTADVLCRIRKMPSGKYRVESEDGSKSFGEYDSKSAAEDRLKQIEHFKHQATSKASATRFTLVLADMQDLELSVLLSKAAERSERERAEWDAWVRKSGAHVSLELDQGQQSTSNGSPEDFVSKGMKELTAQTRAWATHFENAVGHETSSTGIYNALVRARARLSVDKFGRALERRKVQSLMLGVLDDVLDTTGLTEQDIEEKTPEISSEMGDVLDSIGLSRQSYITLAKPKEAFTKLPFNTAVEHFKSLGVLERPAFERATAAIKQRSFTVAGALGDQMLQVLQLDLANSIAAGEDLRNYRKRMSQRLSDAGFLARVGSLKDGTPALSASHVETVFRTNVLNTYNTGRFVHQSSPSVVAAFPVWEIRAVKDARTRETHLGADGAMLLASDPFWDTAYPPFGFNCRCRVIPRSKKYMANVQAGSSVNGLPDDGFTSGRPALAIG